MTDAREAAHKIADHYVGLYGQDDIDKTAAMIQSAIEAEKKEWIKNLNDETITTQDSFQPIIDAAVKGKDKRIDELEEQIRDSAESFKAVMEERCGGDELHCTCVPFLRERIAELEEEADHE